MSNHAAVQCIADYYDAFNSGDRQSMLALLSEEIEHHVNQGRVRHGIQAFEEFSAHMDTCYKEQLSDIRIAASDDGCWAAAEFVVHGTYLTTDHDLPIATGQTYEIPAGSFFSLYDGLITRITTYYNLEAWLDQIRG